MSEIQLEDSRYLMSRNLIPQGKNYRILLTGSSGLIGSNLLFFLNLTLHQNESLMDIDAVTTSTINIDNLHPRIKVIKADLSRGVSKLIQKRYDIIIHAATYGQPQKFIQEATNTMILNSLVVYELIEHLSVGGTFLFLSTSEVYSGGNEKKYTETELGNLSIKNDRAAYVYSKLFGEILLLQHATKFNVRIARVSLSYGPGTKIDDSRVMNELIRQGIFNRCLKLKDDGSAIRTYCYVRDTIEMLMNILFRGQSEVYNVGGISVVTVKELAAHISKELSVPVETNLLKSNFLSAPTTVLLDNSKYLNEFGNMDFVSLKDGIRRTIGWQKKNLFGITS